jgi:hypothetical protein
LSIPAGIGIGIGIGVAIAIEVAFEPSPFMCPWKVERETRPRDAVHRTTQRPTFYGLGLRRVRGHGMLGGLSTFPPLHLLLYRIRDIPDSTARVKGRKFRFRFRFRWEGEK